jgi:hypothetical protein
MLSYARRGCVGNEVTMIFMAIHIIAGFDSFKGWTNSHLYEIRTCDVRLGACPSNRIFLDEEPAS